MSSRRKDQPQSSDDLLWGAEAIADHIGRTKRQTYYLIEIEAIRGYGYDDCVQWRPDWGWVNVCQYPYGGYYPY